MAQYNASGDRKVKLNTTQKRKEKKNYIFSPRSRHLLNPVYFVFTN